MNKKNMLLFSLLCAASFDISSATKTYATSIREDINEEDLRRTYDANLTELSNELNSKSQHIENICNQYKYLEELKAYPESQCAGYKTMAEKSIITSYNAIKETDKEIDQYHKNIGTLYNTMKNKKMNSDGLNANPPKDNETLKQALEELQGLEGLNNELAQKLKKQALEQELKEQANETSRENQQDRKKAFKEKRQIVAKLLGAST